MNRLLLCFVLATPIAAAQDLPATQGFDIHALDKTANPCVDFYQYSCGTWLKDNPIPADQSSWGRLSELAERNRDILHAILEKSSVDSPGRNAVDKQIGDYYAACMDEAAIERKGTAPLKDELARIAALKSLSALPPELARLHMTGVDALFGFGSGQDFKDSTEVIAQADQGGLGLPERDYYFKTDAASIKTRQEYLIHVQNIFQLMGDSPALAASKAKVVMAIETAIAKVSQDVVTRRDPTKIYHRVSIADLASLTPDFSWSEYLADLRAPQIKSLNVVSPDYYKGLDAVLKTTSLEDLKTYLSWHFIHSQIPFLPKAFVAENFNFYSKSLTGAKEQRARWKRCVSYTDSDLGEALGRSYVEKTFGAEGKERTLAMVKALEQSLGQDIEKLDWMTPATKTKAIEKLHAITNKIGYPEHWRDYSSVVVRRDDAIGNSERATRFEFKRQLDKIGKPVDRLEWSMTPPTVNAYYDPQMNNINFPAGILQPPFFDKKMDDAVNFGAIGAIVGHELTHGFDDEGRQFDAQGNLNDWWTPKDADAFDTREQCFIDEYSQFTVTGDLKLNGKLTLGENTADNGGLRIAHMALLTVLAGKIPAKIDGFTAQQRFFLGWGQAWCTNSTEEIKRLRAQTDPHSIPKDRVNGVVSNMPSFRDAFGCTEGQPMVREKACRVW